MDEVQDKPLWRVMAAARENASDGDYVNGEWILRLGPMAAAEIRAVADWLVPVQPEPEMQTLPPFVDYRTAWALWHQRDGFRQRLLAEADRAERGEA